MFPIDKLVELYAFLKYVALVFVDGDVANDWLTWLSADIYDVALELGGWIASLSDLFQQFSG